MSPEQIFTVTNSIAVVGWVLLAALPGRPWVTDVVSGRLLPAVFAVLYIGIVMTKVLRRER